MNEITHRQIVANLDSDQREQLLARSDRAGLRHLAGHLAALALTSIWILTAVPLWQLGLMIHGVLLIFLFTLLHECIHNTPFKTQALNTIVGGIIGFILLLPARWFTYFHLAHHRHTHDPENDPELASPKPDSWWQYISYLSGVPVWRSQIQVLVVNATMGAKDPFIPSSKQPEVKREAQRALLLYALMITASFLMNSAVFLWIWFVPAVLGQPFLRAYLLAEHTLCPHTTNMLENTRTTFTGAIVRFITWNMPYHIEHHTYPAVPFHRLPEFHKILREHLGCTENGYRNFHRKFAAKLNS